MKRETQYHCEGERGRNGECQCSISRQESSHTHSIARRNLFERVIESIIIPKGRIDKFEIDRESVSKIDQDREKEKEEEKERELKIFKMLLR